MGPSVLIWLTTLRISHHPVLQDLLSPRVIRQQPYRSRGGDRMVTHLGPPLLAPGSSNARGAHSFASDAKPDGRLAERRSHPRHCTRRHSAWIDGPTASFSTDSVRSANLNALEVALHTGMGGEHNGWLSAGKWRRALPRLSTKWGPPPPDAARNLLHRRGCAGDIC